ncbi:MAG TPA: hypothetical protein PKL84_08870, partial [Candidatus Hydrogenedentes bacterium]|nr:hypothetical protein [Candidatus Hydrogenedentota bacterium]
RAEGIAFRDGNRVIIGGWARAGLPQQGNALQPGFGGGDRDGFFATLNMVATDPTDVLRYCSYFGGPGDDAVHDISNEGFTIPTKLFLVGETNSPTLPGGVNGVLGALNNGLGGASKDGFGAKLDFGGLDDFNLQFSAYLGGEGDDRLLRMAAGTQRHFACGFSNSKPEQFPDALMVGRFQDALNPGQEPDDDPLAYDGLLLELNFGSPDLILAGVLRFGTLLGGRHSDRLLNVAMTLSNRVYCVGATDSPNFPTLNPFQAVHKSATDAFVFELRGDKQPIYVNVNVAGGAGNGSSWENAYPSIADAVYAAIPPAMGDEIWVAGGVYPENDLAIPTGVSLYGGFNGTEGSRDQRDWIANPTIVESPGPGEVIFVGASEARLDGFVIRNGNGINNGAGLYFQPTYTTIWMDVANCFFYDNSAIEFGGAIYTRNGELRIVNSVFVNNSALMSGGAVYSFANETVITNCTFARNTAVLQGNHVVNDMSFATYTMRVTNCIFAESGNTIINDIFDLLPGTSVFEACLVQGTSTLLGVVTNVFNGNPAFVRDPGATDMGDLRLKPESEAIDAGVATAAEVSRGNVIYDIEGRLRLPLPCSTYDLGAYESLSLPVITVQGDNPLDIECSPTYSDPGATALDACGLDLSA